MSLQPQNCILHCRIFLPKLNVLRPSVSSRPHNYGPKKTILVDGAILERPKIEAEDGHWGKVQRGAASPFPPAREFEGVL